MKGFAATPIIFIAMIMIVATLFMQFSAVDKMVAEGILKETEGSKAAADAMKIENVNTTAIRMRASTLLNEKQNINQIDATLENEFGINFDVVNETTRILVSYTLDTKLPNLNKTQTYTEVINAS